jgi:DNA-3-methyladenine glycosylase
MDNLIWLEDQNIKINNQDILASPRVGVQYAGKDANNPWRFRIKGNPWTSPAP